MARTPETIRHEIQQELAKAPSARRRRQVADLEWELEHLTAASAINERRASLGLEPWPSMVHSQ